MIALLLAVQLAIPNLELTPGAVRPLTLEVICTTKWGLDRRFVTERMKRHVFAAYGIAWADRALYEIDHVIPRSLGGADDILNLRPQPWVGPNNARLKDADEVRLSRAVCAGAVTLATARRTMIEWGAAQ